MKFGRQKWLKAYAFAKALVTFNKPKKERSWPEETRHIGHDHNPTPSQPIDYFALEQHWPFPVIDTPSFQQGTREYVALHEVEHVSHMPPHQEDLASSDSSIPAHLTDLNGQLPTQVPHRKDSVLLHGVEALPPQQAGRSQLLQETCLLLPYPINPEQDLGSQLSNGLFYTPEPPFYQVPPPPQEVSPTYAVQETEQAALPQIYQQQTLQFSGEQFPVICENPTIAWDHLYNESRDSQFSAGQSPLVTEYSPNTLHHKSYNAFDKVFFEIDEMEASVASSGPVETVASPIHLGIPSEQAQHWRSDSFSSTISGHSLCPTALTVSTSAGEIPCPHCDRSFSHRHKLNRHFRSHTLPNACPVRGCGERFAQNGLLKRHLIQAHRDIAKIYGADKIYWCPIPSCKWAFGGSTEGFARRETLKKHCEALSHPPLSTQDWRMVLRK